MAFFRPMYCRLRYKGRIFCRRIGRVFFRYLVICQFTIWHQRWPASYSQKHPVILITVRIYTSLELKNGALCRYAVCYNFSYKGIDFWQILCSLFSFAIRKILESKLLLVQLLVQIYNEGDGWSWLNISEGRVWNSCGRISVKSRVPKVRAFLVILR